MKEILGQGSRTVVCDKRVRILRVGRPGQKREGGYGIHHAAKISYTLGDGVSRLCYERTFRHNGIFRDYTVCPVENQGGGNGHGQKNQYIYNQEFVAQRKIVRIIISKPVQKHFYLLRFPECPGNRPSIPGEICLPGFRPACASCQRYLRRAPYTCSESLNSEGERPKAFLKALEK